MQKSEYVEGRHSTSRFIEVRGLRYHVRHWGDAQLASESRPPLVMLHGWMDMSASFQFIVDALPEDRWVLAVDWRGFGLTAWSGTDCYAFVDYLADLDAAIDALLPNVRFDLVGHSLGATIALLYAGLRPDRVRKLVNLEGSGGRDPADEDAPERHLRWLAQLKEEASLRSFASLEELSERLQKTNPLLRRDRALWLAGKSARCRDDGRWEMLADPAHKRAGPLVHKTAETLAIWRRIVAPVMWVRGESSPPIAGWENTRCSLSEFEERLDRLGSVEKHVLSKAGHMVHHDQPEEVARLIARFVAS